MVDESTHEENLEKYAKRLAVACRDCQHDLSVHLAGVNYKDNTVIVSNCNYFSSMGGFCNCQEFMSPDNLDYIELLAKRKGLISESEDKL